MLKKFGLYALRWQLSTPVLIPILSYCLDRDTGIITATIIANFIGSFIFFWVDKFIFRANIKYPLWEIRENSQCFDCGKQNCRCYRLVKAKNYDRLDDRHPQFRCEACSEKRAEELEASGVRLA
ncbi:MAG: hypothetical protein FWG73_09190 [Planctomycetaceae bacterium]|nr:hypothetical protein [Planctomycetaceae bacterium]